MQNKKSCYLPSEWNPQSAIQLTWPHAETDWGYMINEITACYVDIARSILKYQKLIIVGPNPALVLSELNLNESLKDNLTLIELPTNDTWARDHGAISVIGEGGQKYILDFTFNGWGLKFASNYDNQINRKLFENKVFDPEVTYMNCKNFVFEGGAIESDGKGTLLTTSECLLSPNRNSFLSKKEIEEFLLSNLGAKRLLWLDYGYLAGDDTDSHIDTLARFCDEYTIAYVKCEDENDEHYQSLLSMEKQLKAFVNFEGNFYNLIPLPMADIVVQEGERLPATYANFLIMNEIVLLPFYNSPKDLIAQEKLQNVFRTRKVIGVNCLPIIKQHGSLHCITMQYPEGFI